MEQLLPVHTPPAWVALWLTNASSSAMGQRFSANWHKK